MDELRDREEEVRGETNLDDKIEDLRDLLDVDVKAALSEVEVDLPDADTGGEPDPLLDTKRDLAEQIRRYKDFDIRYA